MKINVKIDKISIKVDGSEELFLTLEAARDLQRDLNNILGSEQKYCGTSLSYRFSSNLG